MKKLKKFLVFGIISAVVLVFLGFVCRFLYKALWNFDILNEQSYKVLFRWWEKGGVFKTFRDCSLGLALILLPVVWLVLSYKLYKKGFWKTIFSPVVYLYRICTRPKNMEVEHVSIKNLGSKDKSLDEIIADKIKAENNEKTNGGNTTQDIRRQIAAKMEEN